MISWLQRNFQQHFKLVFGLILFLTILSFVVSYGPSSGIGGGHKIVLREFFGHKLDGANPNAADFDDARISVDLQLGTSGQLDSDQIATFALERIAALHIADQLNLPATSPADQVEFIKSLRMFAGSNGQFDPQRYEMFRQNMSSSPNGGQILQVIDEDARIARVQALLAGPGYVLPLDVRTRLVREDTQWTIGTATVSYASFKPSISPSEDDIAKFFQQNSFRYEIPPTVDASYVDFPATSHIGDVKVSDAEVRAYYDANRSRFPAPAKPAIGGKTAMAGPDSDFAAVRNQVRASLMIDRARNAAVQAASDLAYGLYDKKVEAGAPLQDYLAARKLALKPLAPFTQDAFPPQLGGSPEVAAAAFKLNADRYFSDAFATPDGAAVLIWSDTRPAHAPLLAEVRAKVVADYVENDRRERFVALGRDLHDRIQDAVKRGEAFDKAAAAAGAALSVKVDAKMLPPFTLASPPKEVDETIEGPLEHMSKGQLSDMALTADNGYLVYVADRKVPAANPNGPRFAEVRGELAYDSARAGAGSYLSQIVDQELKRTEPAAQK